ncbi:MULTISPECIES: circularly permuted type 2 ATP-grasp protein [Rheinheimera]|uniref:Circularly permuted type 2 ATP-grasp protein n=1 Tax=Rheinheimera marina TaxID=1774958 RepID=A0ABV9JK20_9GAMM
MTAVPDPLELWWASCSAAEQAQLQQELNRQLQDLNPAAAQPHLLAVQPLLLGADEWRPLSRALLQRHRLYNLILADLYGEQQLLQQGLLPAAELLSSPLYQLPCHRLMSEHHHWLTLFAMQVSRMNDGRFFVRQHLACPAGLGLVVQHRLAMNQLPLPASKLPERLHLAQFFRDLKQLLRGTDEASDQSGVLSTGKGTQNYAELNFLAGYLDLPLLQSADLMFKDGTLHLKTVAGLKPVASLLCALPDAETDALELNNTGLGAAGLVQSIRQGQLTLINPPGAGLVQHPLLQLFLAELCPVLLGEPLLLPSLPSYWGGQHDLLPYLTPQSELYQISTDQRLHWEALTTEQQQHWYQQVQRNGKDFVVQQLSVGPGGGLPPIRLQLFSLQQQDQLTFLPGALAQQQLEATTGPASLQFRDVWFEGQSADQQSLWRSSQQQLRLNRNSGVLPSRIADHLFWLGRYNERLNLMSRVLRQLVQMATLEQRLRPADSELLLQFCLFANGAGGAEYAPGLPAGLDWLCDPARQGSLPQSLNSLLFNAKSVQEYFSEDSWYVLEQLQSQTWPQQLSSQPALLIRQLDQLLLLQTAIYGMNNETMTRTPGLNFLQAGQQLERALQMSHLLQLCFTQPTSISASQQEALLRLTDTQMTYRRRYGSELHPLAVLDLLLLDDSTPRSVSYPLCQLDGLLALLPDNDGLPQLTSALQQLRLRLTTDASLLLQPDLTASAELQFLLNQLQLGLRELSEQLTRGYFSHAEPSWRWQRF